MEGYPVRSGVNSIPCEVCKGLVRIRVLKDVYPVLLPVAPTQIARLKMGKSESARATCVRGHLAQFNIRY